MSQSASTVVFTTHCNPLLALVASLLLAGCGSGGGGGDNAGTPTPPAPPPPPAPGPPDSTASIDFPTIGSVAITRTLEVTGTASDPEGIAEVTVNGVAATLAAAGAETTSWSAEIPLDLGETTILVSVEDTLGSVTTDAATESASRTEVPTSFEIDIDSTRLVGLSSAWVGQGIEKRLVQHNYATGAQVDFGELEFWPMHSCFRRLEDESIYIYMDQGEWFVRRFDLTSGQDEALLSIDSADWDAGAGFGEPWPADLICDSRTSNAYVLVTHSSSNGFDTIKSRILSIDLATLAVSQLAETSADAWIAEHIALDGDQIVTIPDDVSPPGSMASVSILDGSRSELAPSLDFAGQALAPVLAANKVYVASGGRIDETDLLTEARRDISPADGSEAIRISNIISIGYDGPNNRIVVGDEEDLASVTAVDIATGERSLMLARSAGDGRQLITPRALAISDDGNTAYVADDGRSGPERLFRINLLTGDRLEIGDIDQAGEPVIYDLEIDEDGGQAFVAFGDSVIQVDLDTQLVSTIVDTDSSSLGSIVDLLFDAAANRLLIADSINDGIYELDLLSGVVDLVSQTGVRGDGADFGSPGQIVWGPGASEIYTGTQDNQLFYRVDLVSGDREVVDYSCDGPEPNATLFDMAYDPAAGEVLAYYGLFGGLFAFDLQTGDCDRVDPPRQVLDAEFMPSGELLATTWEAIVQVNPKTGEMIIVSH